MQAMVSEQASDQLWGAHAQRILDGSMWKPPANGGHNDQAHPPIHPTKYSPGEADWSADKKRLYEFIVRSFLATCSKAAIGKETKIHIGVAQETFVTTGKAYFTAHAIAVGCQSLQSLVFIVQGMLPFKRQYFAEEIKESI